MRHDQLCGRADVEVDSRVERGHTVREALEQLLEHERYDTIVVPADFDSSDAEWLREHADGDVVELE